MAAGATFAQYQQPPEALLEVMRAPRIPMPQLDPTGHTILFVRQGQYPSIARVAEPYLKLAGVRIEPAAHTRHDRSSGYGIRSCLEGFSLVSVASGAKVEVHLPEDACPNGAAWSPDGRYFAFTNTTDRSVELWVGEAATGSVRRIEGIHVNTILESSVQWVGDRAQLLVKTVPTDLGPAPKSAVVPTGPEIKDATDGASGASSTYEARDLLASPEDEALFEYYATAQLVLVDLAEDTQRKVGPRAVLGGVDVAPDGRHVLYSQLTAPWSRVVAWTRFARDVKVLDLADGSSRTLVHLPAAERVPVHGVPTGPRGHGWRANEPATLLFSEALDGGDWANDKASHRDRVLMWRAPFNDAPIEITRTEMRYAGLNWFEQGSQAFLVQYDRNRSLYRSSLVDVDTPGDEGRVLFELSMDERYEDPGNPLFKRLANGAWVMHERDGVLFFRGSGATPEGDRPFLDYYWLEDGRTRRVFRSAADGLERVIGFAQGNPDALLTWYQTPEIAPQVRQIRLDLADDAQPASEPEIVFAFDDPTPQVRQIKKQLVSYQRDDGVELSFTLYTPPGYQEGERLPAILYAYPLDYAEAAQAGQVSGSTQTFTQLSGHRLLLLAGYAIIDNASIPIVGDPKSAYDTYIDQLVAGAQAAVDKAVDMGVVDPDRIGVTGHSHGALMTANLLAHSDLFRAGVASSGAYNKTLTPFGFQSERRSFWEAPEVYDQASTFFHADKIKAPILIVHGMDDANPGTEPTQSPRLFQAVRGLGGMARLVMLPHEPHWYAARESNEHFVAEMLEWFDRYVKQAQPAD